METSTEHKRHIPIPARSIIPGMVISAHMTKGSFDPRTEMEDFTWCDEVTVNWTTLHIYSEVDRYFRIQVGEEQFCLAADSSVVLHTTREDRIQCPPWNVECWCGFREKRTRNLNGFPLN